MSATSSSNPFFDAPILNSPYARPSRHWELDAAGQPTQHIIENRRSASFVTPIPKPKKVTKQASLLLGDEALSSAAQAYEKTSVVLNQVRERVDRWRREPESRWNVTPETARLLRHWREWPHDQYRPFFCQLEAVETVIWLTEVAPELRKKDTLAPLEYLERANRDANPKLARLALKLATGAGKTTVMAMLIAWQTLNAVRRPQSSRYTRGFLVVSPGITIRDRLRVLLPSDPDNYYADRKLVPDDMLIEMQKAKVVVTNFHAFKPRDELELAKGNRSLLQGRGAPLDTLESPGKMVRRVMDELMGLKGIMVFNDEAHHCYREKPEPEEDSDALDADDKKEADENNKAARVWITGLEAVDEVLGVRRVIDLSATPFFLSGSGYVEGTLFPWTMCDFSLMDAIESGIVKLPRVPIADNIPGNEMPMYRDLWRHIRKQMPKKGRGQDKLPDPQMLPAPLQTALDALYGHYKKTFEAWQAAGHDSPPCFIVVCNNTATSRLVYELISGYSRTRADGTEVPHNGRLPLFRNFDEHGNPYPKPRTLLIDSRQLEADDALDPAFREAAADEIERFRREHVERTGSQEEAAKFTDTQLLREVMNTVGKPGKLGADVRCVVSVAMLTEGWDANTVTHVLGVRAFGTQLLCEQVIGRALRRRSYALGPDGHFPVEYADVLGIPFDFTAKPVISTPQPPGLNTRIHAVKPERDALEIRFPRVAGYRTELPATQLVAEFTEDSTLTLTPELVGATETQNSGIIGERVNLNLEHTGDVRPSTVLYALTAHLVNTRFKDKDGEPELHLFGQLKRIAREWVDKHLVCKGGTYPAQLAYKTLAEMACERIEQAIDRPLSRIHAMTVVPDPYNPTGSSAHVNYHTVKRELWSAEPTRSHVNKVVLDSDWEAELCRVVESHPKVLRYVKNAGLGFEVPYVFKGEVRHYRPDFIVVVDDGRGPDDPLNLVIEVKGFRGEDVKDKSATMQTRWVPGVNRDGRWGRWAFAELGDVYEIAVGFATKVGKRFDEAVAGVVK